MTLPCWVKHKWTKWSDTQVRTEFGEESGQIRYCEKCGLKQIIFSW